MFIRPACKEFFSAHELDSHVDIAVVDNVTCYPEKHGAYGWCYTKKEEVTPTGHSWSQLAFLSKHQMEIGAFASTPANIRPHAVEQMSSGSLIKSLSAD